MIVRSQHTLYCCEFLGLLALRLRWEHVDTIDRMVAGVRYVCRQGNVFLDEYIPLCKNIIAKSGGEMEWE